MGRRGGRRTRSDSGGRRRNVGHGVGFPGFEHAPWTFEGYIERLGAFTRGVNQASGWKRSLGRVIALSPILWIPLAFVIVLVALLFDWLT